MKKLDKTTSDNLLSGMARVDFENWLEKQHVAPYRVMFWDIPKIVQNAYIIEWLDVLGYTIDRDSYNKKMTITNWRDGLEDQIIIDCDYLDPFKDWWKEAIEKANKIYNNQ